MEAHSEPTNVVAAEARTVIARPVDQVFDQVVPIDLPLIFKGHWPLPAVIGTRDQTGPWITAGQSRTILLSDDTTAHEQLLDVVPASYFSYRVDKFTGTLGSLADHANGEWWFEADPESKGTVVRWRYAFVPKSQCSAIALKAVVALFWRQYMAEALQAAKTQVEHSDPASTR